MVQAATGYNGNANLPKAGTTYSMTADQIDEYRKCMASPSYFAENYFKIVTLDNGLQLIKLYDFQKEASDAYLDTNKLLMATSRQIGKTTIATVIILHYVLFNEHKSVFVLANKAATAQEVLSRVQLAYEYLPHWLKCGVVEWNKMSVEFENGSKVTAAATSSDGIRGKSCLSGDTKVCIELDETDLSNNQIQSYYYLPIEEAKKLTDKIYNPDIDDNMSISFL